MIGLLNSIITTITSLLNFLIMSVTSLVNLIIHIPTYISFLTTSIGFLPSIILPFAIATIMLYSVKFIIGRQ